LFTQLELAYSTRKYRLCKKRGKWNSIFWGTYR